jgi:protein-L-isoaspartate(D-aspartate) O-methyltransferase
MSPGWTAARVVSSLALAALVGTDAAPAADVSREQAALLAEIERDFRATATYTGEAALAPAVASALAAVPRHRFVQEADRERAYLNRPLRIGHGQTISQPFIVALMTQLARPEPTHRVLEIGTGSGYQAAVLAELVAEVRSIEIVPALAAGAAERLRELGYLNVQVRAGDGNHGWPDAAPFDAILVTAAGRLPPALVEQLAPRGRLVIPIERGAGDQELVVITRGPDGEAVQETILPVRFVPLTGDN